MKIEVREDRLKKCTLPCLKSEWNGINFFCFSRSHEEILSNVMTWFSLKSWPRMRAILRWFHGFSTNTDASPLRILCFTRTLCFTWTRATIQRRLQSWFLLSNVSYFYFASPLPSHQPPPPPHSLYAWLNLLKIYFLLYLTLLVSFSKNIFKKLST